LIGIAPTGSITFISQAWGGRVSDSYHSSLGSSNVSILEMLFLLIVDLIFMANWQTEEQSWKYQHLHGGNNSSAEKKLRKHGN